MCVGWGPKSKMGYPGEARKKKNSYTTESFSGVRGDFSEQIESLPSSLVRAAFRFRHAQGMLSEGTTSLPPHKPGVAPSTFPH